jgi:phage-related tail fiber protein
MAGGGGNFIIKNLLCRGVLSGYIGGGGGNESMVVVAGVGQGRRRTADNSRQRQWSVAGRRTTADTGSGV